MLLLALGTGWYDFFSLGGGGSQTSGSLKGLLLDLFWLKPPRVPLKLVPVFLGA